MNKAVKAASRLLGLNPKEVTEDNVRAAFKQKAFDAHPDTGQTPDNTLIAKYKKARDLINAYITNENDLQWCEKCNGTGEMKTRRGGLLKCSTCAGQGKYTPRTIRRM